MSAAPPAPLVIIAAGEASGDKLGAGLIQALRQLRPDIRFAGIGGDAMAAAGMTCWHDVTELSVMGLAEVLRDLPRLLKLRHRFIKRLLEARPALYIGIDAPDFNFPIEKRLKRSGVATIHYASPSVWAWRPKRVWQIAQCCDHLLCLFPFEPPYYAATGLTTTVVGHPRADEIPLEQDSLAVRRDQLRQTLGIREPAAVIALLPGSRHGERKRLWPVFLDSARALLAPPGQTPAIANQLPVHFVTAQADKAGRQWLQDTQQQHAPELVIHYLEDIDQALLACDYVLAASGTVTLEALLYHRPQVAAYKLNGLTYQLVKHLRLMRSPWLTLPNILAADSLIPEIFQHQANAHNLAQALSHWQQNPAACAEYRQHARDIHQSLRKNAHQQAAQVVIGMLGNSERVA